MFAEEIVCKFENFSEMSFKNVLSYLCLIFPNSCYPQNKLLFWHELNEFLINQNLNLHTANVQPKIIATTFLMTWFIAYHNIHEKFFFIYCTYVGFSQKILDGLIYIAIISAWNGVGWMLAYIHNSMEIRAKVFFNNFFCVHWRLCFITLTCDVYLLHRSYLPIYFFMISIKLWDVMY